MPKNVPAPKKRTELQFKRPQMGESQAAVMWQSLAAAIQEIHRQNSSTLSFEELYRSAYNLVLNRHGDMLYNGLRRCVEEHLTGVVEGLVQCAAERDFVEAVATAWRLHLQSMMRIRDVLMYVDRVHVVDHGLPTVFDLGLDLFQSLVLQHAGVAERVPEAMWNLIQLERGGEVIDRGLLQRLCSMYLTVGRDAHELYSERFETMFLARSSDYFRSEAQTWIGSNAAPEFIIKVEQRLEEERLRALECMCEATEKKLTASIEDAYIARHMQSLLDMEGSGLVVMLDNERLEDLHRLFKLMRRVPGGLDLLLAAVCAHVVRVGESLVEDKIVVLKTGQKKEDPKMWMAGILEHREQCDRLLRDAFDSCKPFQVGIMKAFETYVNRNPRSPEYLSLFMDAYLRKGLKEESDDSVEVTLERAMILFRYIEDKDVFETYYKKHLSARLLYARSASDDAERAMIQKIKTDCGFQFTTKLEGMFQDMAVSADLTVEFSAKTELVSTLGGIDFSAHVLTTTFWPVRDDLVLVLPRPMARCVEVFTNFYLAKHAGRVLTWQPALGTADVRGVFAERSHELVVSTLQAAVLLLFNDSESLSVGEICAALRPSADGVVKKSLVALTTGEQKILRRESKTKELTDSDRLVFNAEFKSKLFRVKVLQVAAKRDTDPQRATVQSHVEEDRKHYIEAAIVRIMKARKTMEHNALIAEVCRLLSRRFVANPNQVKKRVESLIEREYLERDKVNRRNYNYLA